MGRIGRPISALGVLAFTFGMGADAYGLHPCPHHHPEPEPAGETHDSAPAHQEAPESQRSAAESTFPEEGERRDHAHEEAHGDAHSSDGPHHEDGPCACLGECAGGAAPSAPAAGVAERPEPTRDPGARPGPADLLPHRIHLPHVLPYPLGPPGDTSF